MESFDFGFFLVFFAVLGFICPSSSLPLCTDLRAPLTQKTPLSFCPYNGTSCCNSAKDLQLRTQFQRMNISDPSCASAIKSILCATCDQFSAKLYTVESNPRPVPLLCNSTDLRNNFCSSLWNTCQNVSILNSPFAPSLQGRGGVSQNSTASTLTDLWQSETDFCVAFGGASGSNDSSVCFNGEPISLNKTEPSTPPNGICLERIGTAAYLSMAAHPDGSNRAFFSDQPGKIWLAEIPEQGSGQSLGLDESTPFVDLTDQIHFDTTFGMMGMAFHPNFAQNGRFFASFNCDKVKSPGCAGRCACNSDVNCDPSKLGASSGSQPCQYHSVVAEYSANGTESDPSKAKKAKPAEVRRIFTMGLPFRNNHGGQILFGPADGNLYIMMGDGGGNDDPFRLAQNKRSLLGKIMRVDVDNLPSEEEIINQGLWGNYSIPQDNPFVNDGDSLGEIWALGLRNPWRCSFDVESPSYFFCADTGQDRYEEVDMITKGGNYGWSMYEGPLPYNSQKSTRTNYTDSTELIFPVVGYNHSDINKKEGSAAISGGYFYRSNTDSCTYGSYLYADLYASAIWSAFENPKGSGKFTTNKVPFSCASDSPMECSSVPNSNLPALGYIFSFGEDNNKDIYLLTSTGTYRVVGPSRCNYTCSKETLTPAASTPTSSPRSSGNSLLNSKYTQLQLIFSSFLVFVGLSLL